MAMMAMDCLFPACGQTPAHGAGTETAGPNVNVNVLVLDRNRQPFTGAVPSAFQLREEGTSQTIRSVGGSDTPVSLCLLIDNSASTRTIHLQIVEAATAVVKDLPAGSEIAVFRFEGRPSVVLPFTAAASVQSSTFEKLQPNGGNAAFDAVTAGNQYLAKHARNERRAMVLINDGDENASDHSLQDVERSLQSPNAPVLYVLNIPNEWSDSERSVPYRNFMKAVQGMNDGLLFEARSEKDLVEWAAEISKAIQSQYLLTYTTTAAPDGKLHKLNLRIQAGKSGTKIYHPPAYYAPTQ